MINTGRSEDADGSGSGLDTVQPGSYPQSSSAAGVVRISLQKDEGVPLGFRVAWCRPPRVEAVHPGSVAAQAGLIPGDRLLSAAGTSLIGLSEEDALQLLRDQTQLVDLDVWRDAPRHSTPPDQPVGSDSTVVAPRRHLDYTALLNSLVTADQALIGRLLAAPLRSSHHPCLHCQHGTEHPLPCSDGTEHPPPCSGGTEHQLPCAAGTEHPSPCPGGTEHPPPCSGGTEHPPPCSGGTEHPPPCPAGTEHPSPCPARKEHPSPCPGGTEHPLSCPGGTEHPPPCPARKEHPPPCPAGTEHPSPCPGGKNHPSPGLHEAAFSCVDQSNVCWSPLEGFNLIDPEQQQAILQNIEHIIIHVDSVAEEVMESMALEDNGFSALRIFYKHLDTSCELFREYFNTLEELFSEETALNPIEDELSDYLQLPVRYLKKRLKILRRLQGLSSSIETPILQTIITEIANVLEPTVAVTEHRTTEEDMLVSQPQLTYMKGIQPVSLVERRWVHADELLLRRGRQWRPCYLVLLSDLLLITQRNRQVVFVTEQPLPLSQILHHSFNVKKKETEFHLSLPAAGTGHRKARCLVFRATSLEAKLAWEDQFHKQMSLMKASQSSGSLASHRSISCDAIIETFKFEDLKRPGAGAEEEEGGSRERCRRRSSSPTAADRRLSTSSGSQTLPAPLKRPKPSTLRARLFGPPSRPRPLNLKKVSASAKCCQYLSSLTVPTGERGRVTPVFEREGDMTIADFVKKRQKVLFDVQSADSADGAFETFLLDEASSDSGTPSPAAPGSRHVSYGCVSVVRYRGVPPPPPRRCRPQYNPYLDDRIEEDYPELVGAPVRRPSITEVMEVAEVREVSGVSGGTAPRRGLLPSPSMKFADEDDLSPTGPGRLLAGLPVQQPQGASGDQKSSQQASKGLESFQQMPEEQRLLEHMSEDQESSRQAQRNEESHQQELEVQKLSQPAPDDQKFSNHESEEFSQQAPHGAISSRGKSREKPQDERQPAQDAGLSLVSDMEVSHELSDASPLNDAAKGHVSTISSGISADPTNRSTTPADSRKYLEGETGEQLPDSSVIELSLSVSNAVKEKHAPYFFKICAGSNNEASSETAALADSTCSTTNMDSPSEVPEDGESAMQHPSGLATSGASCDRPLNPSAQDEACSDDTDDSPQNSPIELDVETARHAERCMSVSRTSDSSGSQSGGFVDSEPPDAAMHATSTNFIAMQASLPVNFTLTSMSGGDLVKALQREGAEEARRAADSAAFELTALRDDVTELEDSAYMSRSDELLERHSQKVLSSAVSSSLSSLARRAGSIPSSLDCSNTRLGSADLLLACRSEEVLPAFRCDDGGVSCAGDGATALLTRHGTSCDLVSDVRHGFVPCMRGGRQPRPYGRLVARQVAAFERQAEDVALPPPDWAAPRARGLRALWQGAPPVREAADLSPATPSSRGSYLTSGSPATTASASDLESAGDDATLAPSSGDSQNSLLGGLPELEDEVAPDLMLELADGYRSKPDTMLPLSDIEEITEEMDGFISGSDVLSPISEEAPSASCGLQEQISPYSDSHLKPIVRKRQTHIKCDTKLQDDHTASEHMRNKVRMWANGIDVIPYTGPNTGSTQTYRSRWDEPDGIGGRRRPSHPSVEQALEVITHSFSGIGDGDQADEEDVDDPGHRQVDEEAGRMEEHPELCRSKTPSLSNVVQDPVRASISEKKVEAEEEEQFLGNQPDVSPIPEDKLRPVDAYHVDDTAGSWPNGATDQRQTIEIDVQNIEQQEASEQCNTTDASEEAMQRVDTHLNDPDNQSDMMEEGEDDQFRLEISRAAEAYQRRHGDQHTPEEGREMVEDASRSAEGADAQTAQEVIQFTEEAELQRAAEADQPAKVTEEINRLSRVPDDQPTEVMEASCQLTERLEKDDQPTEVLEEVNQPTEVLKKADQPTEVTERADQPSEVPDQQPTGVTEETDQPTEVLEEADQPTEVLKKADQPMEMLEEANQPTEVLEGANQPTEVLEGADQPSEVMEEADQPSEVPDHQPTAVGSSDDAQCRLEEAGSCSGSPRLVASLSRLLRHLSPVSERRRAVTSQDRHAGTPRVKRFPKFWSNHSRQEKRNETVVSLETAQHVGYPPRSGKLNILTRQRPFALTTVSRKMAASEGAVRVQFSQPAAL